MTCLASAMRRQNGTITRRLVSPISFVFGVFSGHAVYFPELFPTQIRSTGVASCNGAARIITSFGPLIAGLLAAALGGFRVAAAIMVCFALLSVVAMLLGRETKGSQRPH